MRAVVIVTVSHVVVPGTLAARTTALSSEVVDMVAYHYLFSMTSSPDFVKCQVSPGRERLCSSHLRRSRGTKKKSLDKFPS